MNFLNFFNSVISVMRPLWISDYFRFPAVFFVLLLCVSLVKYLIGGSCRVSTDF